ncbi:MAG TPA: hypothetical protein VFA98_06280 [Thermoanaerobaculia bacterium]|nr:hypothetical protein [Thermoanaerobaculia bacterium]
MKARKKRATGALPLLSQSWDGSPESKARFHKDAQAVLRAVATEAGLGPKDFEVSSNVMGPVVIGSVSLFADRFHLWIYGGSSGEWGTPREGDVTARRVAHRKDYAGSGENVAIDWELLWDPPSLVKVLKLEGVIA